MGELAEENIGEPGIGKNTRVWLSVGAAVCAGVFAAFVWMNATREPVDVAPTLEQRSMSAALSVLAGEHEDDAPDTARFYRERGFEPCWMTATGLNSAGVQLMRRLTLDDGSTTRSELVRTARLASVDFGRDRVNGALSAIAYLEWSLSEGLRRLALDLAHGRLNPSKVQAGWFHRDEPLDVKAFLEDAVKRGPAVVIEELRASHEERTGLEAARVLYESIDRAGGWQPVPSTDEPLERGARSPEVIALKARLLVTGDLGGKRDAGGAAETDQELFDDAVERAVQTFQTRHGLVPDGRVGKDTLAAMNVPIAVRLRQIRVNLERRRWLPRSFGSEYVWVNVPEYRLYAFRDHRLVLRTNVVVGQPKMQTPLFSETLRYIVFNPYWNVPESIAMDELWPKQRLDPSYLPSRGYEVVGTDSVPLPVDALTPEALAAGDVRIRRLPGSHNDLGQVKFMLPNPYNVYLHDTPARGAFSRPERALSHGCVRLERPMDFASYLLQTRMASREVAEARRSAEPQQFDLDHVIPVYFVYFTAYVDNGVVNFRDDVYGLDDALWLALERHEGPALPTWTARLERP